MDLLNTTEPFGTAVLFDLTDAAPVGFRLTVAAEPGGRDVRVRLHGELDTASAPDVAAGLAPLTVRVGGPGPHVRGTAFLDLADLGFLDTAGLTALRRGRAALRASGWQVRLTRPQPAVRRLLEHAVRSGWFPGGTVLPTPRHPGRGLG